MGIPLEGENVMNPNQLIQFLDSVLDEASTDDGEPNKLPNIPEQNPEIQTKQMEDDIGGANLEDPELGADEIGEMVVNFLDNILVEQEDNEYQTYFREVMKKHGIESIKDLDPDQKKEFFEDVSAGWKNGKKVKENIDMFSENYKEYFKDMLDKEGKSLSSMSDDEKKEFFKKVDDSWKSVKEQQIYKEYRKYFTYMLDKCGVQEFNALTEIEQAEFMSLVNEAFETMNELIQKPGMGPKTKQER